MDRTSAANFIDIGGGRRGFRNRNLGTGVRGTTHDAADRNALQEEIMAVIEAAGLVPNSADWTQLLAALRNMFGGGIQAFPSNGTFVVPAGVFEVDVEVWGPGGGGSGSTNGVADGFGGAGGGYARRRVAVTPGQSISVTIGAPGGGGAAGLQGGTGGTSSFGSAASATGGTGGSAVSGGTAGVGIGGDLNLTGSAGTGLVAVGVGGRGGVAPMIGIGADFAANGAGNDCPAPGGGGGGASRAGNFAGGAAGAGLVIVEW
ncbi:hypothetical protein [Falsiroseomonas sp.]|uniref:glycine-rich domain-containing protein n=1 Tax=Falsiroseomonas sp. TaxID=2870721 RepID=UPI00271AE18D|nr:hypothetical protein [Falsiroseomonas sp.]MDO9501379.1 hypothetical protein [Falsiroseomonas sp.]